MSSEKTFYIAFIVSVLAHGILLFQNPNFNLSLLSKKKDELNPEVSYLRKIEEGKELHKAQAPRKEPAIKLPSNIAITKAAPPFMNRENIFKKNKGMISREPLFTRPEFVKPDIIAVRKKITLPDIDLDKIDNPSYLGYYQIVREKIRRSAYQNYARTDTGQVYLAFLISSDGSLGTVQLIEEQSSSNQYLRDVALRSIRDAAPFPTFPKELDYPQLSFNVVISFEIE